MMSFGQEQAIHVSGAVKVGHPWKLTHLILSFKNKYEYDFIFQALLPAAYSVKERGKVKFGFRSKFSFISSL